MVHGQMDGLGGQIFLGAGHLSSQRETILSSDGQGELPLSSGVSPLTGTQDPTDSKTFTIMMMMLMMLIKHRNVKTLPTPNLSTLFLT